MQLSQYLAAHGLSPEQFAAQIGVHRTSVVRFCNGTRRPDLTTLEKIHNATNGQVRAEDFYDASAQSDVSATLQTQPIVSPAASTTSKRLSQKSSEGSKAKIEAQP